VATTLGALAVAIAGAYVYYLRRRSKVGVASREEAALMIQKIARGRSVRRQLAADDAAAAEREEITTNREKLNNECTFWFVDADRIRSCDDLETLPSFQQLCKQEGWMHTHTIKQAQVYTYDGSLSKKFCAVSHRWLNPKEPDKSGEQFKAIRNYLLENVNIAFVWFDFWCMPQGKRTGPERVQFMHMLKNVNLLYLGTSVLILLELSYISRFWTQFEAWLAMQKIGDKGLEPASAEERRCKIVPILNANSMLVQSLEAIWSAKKPEEAYDILSKDDVTVTNLKDKEQQLKKLQTLPKEVEQQLKNLRTIPDEVSTLQKSEMTKQHMATEAAGAPATTEDSVVPFEGPWSTEARAPSCAPDGPLTDAPPSPLLRRDASETAQQQLLVQHWGRRCGCGGGRTAVRVWWLALAPHPAPVKCATLVK